MSQFRNRRGFTLIELMLAMTFVSILLIAIAMLTIQISKIYTKGITLRQVNEVGLQVSSDLQRSIQSSNAFEVPTVGSNDSYVRQGTGGRLCLGNYSYAWNYGEFIAKHEDDGLHLDNVFSFGSGLSDTTIRLVKVADASKLLCSSVEGDYPGIPGGDRTAELLAAGDRDLALQKFVLSGSEQKGLYDISLQIGTNERAALDEDNCKPPAEAAGLQDYCAVNKFDIVARTANKAHQ